MELVSNNDLEKKVDDKFISKSRIKDSLEKNEKYFCFMDWSPLKNCQDKINNYLSKERLITPESYFGKVLQLIDKYVEDIFENDSKLDQERTFHRKHIMLHKNTEFLVEESRDILGEWGENLAKIFQTYEKAISD